MIAFGELRRFATKWGVLPDVVERTYALNWLIKGIFDRGDLARMFVLRGESALSKAYFSDYPLIEGVDCGFDKRAWDSIEPKNIRGEFETGAQEAAKTSGLKFSLVSVDEGEARFDFVGPLGRRSAAQPHLSVRLAPVVLRRAPSERKLIHPFTDTCDATVRAVSLEELAAEQIASLLRAPRARDIFDLWFMIMNGLARDATLALAKEIADEKKAVMPDSSTLLTDAHRVILARGWENALKKIPSHPAFEQVEADLRDFIGK